MTLVGYSLNDTIIVYDRIRENSRTSRKTTPPGGRDIINLSVNRALAVRS